MQKARGAYLGGKPRFGWRMVEVGNDRALVVADPEQQAALTQMRTLRDQGTSFRKIAEMITAEGISISREGVKKGPPLPAMPRPYRSRASAVC